MHAASSRRRTLLTLLALCAELVLLAREHLHGGVVAHHLLANPDLPAVSNWWGLLLVPLLTWWTVGRIDRRARLAASGGSSLKPAPIIAFLCALAYGATLAALFAAGSPLVDYIFFGLLALALVVRLWHAEYLLGFVLAMSLVAGPILPAMFGAVIALLSWLVHTAARALWRRLRPGLA
ncbi:MULTISPECIES: hypothetical protein [Massilia]|uniref:Uncharacterized protein n=1 Tax=Massilia aurea TaxID=373040 RepID=A0A422QEG8_9BURK|nr:MULTISPECIES: hypothetical protein [Massilia]MDY0960967.1 hypothetical protein [Massilia sp. CFBP9026]RNF28422.1 hypothetical protein NM04_23270 [Massilia aurea]